MTRRPRVTICSPVFQHSGADDTPVSKLRAVASRLRGGYDVGGGNTRDAIATICTEIANELELEAESQRELGTPPNLLLEAGDCRVAARCLGCGDYLIEIRPDQSFDLIAKAWDTHHRLRRCA